MLFLSGTTSCFEFIQCMYMSVLVRIFVECTCIEHTHAKHSCVSVQGGEDSYDPLSCRLFSTKEPLNIGHFCGK